MPAHTGVLRRALLRGTARAASLVSALQAAESLGRPAHFALSRRWRTAVDQTSFPFLPEFIRERLDMVVDVGANRGDWSLGILTLASPRRLLAFEPNPAVFAQLEKNLSGTVAECVQAAVGAQVGTTTLIVERQSELSSIMPLAARGRAIHGIDEPSSLRVEVPLTTLDAKLAQVPRVSLLKLDVQGYEREVVAGAHATLAKTDCLVTEVMYESEYYEGALPCLDLCALIERVSPLRLSCITRPRMGQKSLGAWADAVFVASELLH